MAEQAAHNASPTGYLELVLKNANYRAIWFGEVVSLFGDWFDLIASAALVAKLTQSGLAVGGLFVVRMLAPFLVSPFAGVAADRYNRKTLLILSDIIRGFVVLGFLLVRSSSQIWLLYAVTAIQLGVSGFFFPARNALLPDIVSPRELGAANALSSATWSVMLAMGAALGGFAAGAWGIYPSFVVDSLSFFVSAAMISRIHYDFKPTSLESEKSLSAGIRQYLDGLDYLKQKVDVLAITLHKGAISLIVNSGFQIIMVALAERVFIIGQGGGAGLGLLYAVGGVGTGIGPILARRFTRDDNRLLRIGLAVSYVFCFLGLAISIPLSSFGLVLLGSFIRAFGGGINWVFSTQLLMQLVPGKIRGRVFSTEFAIFTLASAIGSAVCGWALDNTSLGISGLIFWMSALTVIPGVLWTLWIAWGNNRMEIVEN
jgi:MFS family permease